MFFTVKHGADELALFNPDCSLSLLVDSIKTRCNFPSGAAIGLADENCVIINLSEQNNEVTSSCTSLFTDRGLYTLIAIYKLECGPKYKPLVDNVDSDLAIKLETLANPRAVACRNVQLKNKTRPKVATLPISRGKARSSAAGRNSRGK